MNSPYVFLSYSHDNEDAAQQLIARLTAEGIPCWIDHDGIRGLENYNYIIDVAVENCAVFIAMLSRSYVEKFYCEHEFNRAIDTQRCIMPVCVDDVREKTNPKKGYMFSRFSGYNILRLGVGLSGTEEDFADFCRGILESVPMEQFRRLLAGDTGALPPVSPSDYLLEHLRRYNRLQYQQSGNYALNELCAQLFPAIRDVDLGTEYRDDEDKSVSLVRYLSDRENLTKPHVFVVGEGGMGKTVSLLKTCEYLLDQHRCAIYVPLSVIGKDRSLDSYLRDYVCGSHAWIYEHLNWIMKNPESDDPDVVFLLDGVNELAPGGYIDDLFVNQIRRKYVDSGYNVQFVITSRYDVRAQFGLSSSFNLLSMQPLDADRVDSYLALCGLAPVADEKVRAILKTPLLLTLYANVEKHGEKYRKIEGITLHEQPDTAGKILGNFFKTQLFRAAAEPSFDHGDHLVLLEYLLPRLAFGMVREGCLYLEEDLYWDCLDEIEDTAPRFDWYRRDRLRRILRGKAVFETRGAERLMSLADEGLHFLHRVDGRYEFLHQTFRDYFAAYHVANELQAFGKNRERMERTEHVHAEIRLSEDVLSFLADITGEERARPYMDEEGWHFPGKRELAPSEESLAEQMLPFWQGKTGVRAQNAVYNLLQVMRLGRGENLASCDFSWLDLRACRMNGCKFTEWYADTLHPSRFDGAWMDREFFVTNGHEVAVTAVCTDGGDRVFSGDKDGIVKIHDRSTRMWRSVLQPRSGTVVHLAFHKPTGRLAILYGDMLFLWDSREERMISRFPNGSRSKKFRYVDFDGEGNVRVSYDVEPLLWCTPEGEVLPTSLAYDVPARCARWHPHKKELIRSCLLQLLSVDTFCEESGCWEQHPVLRERTRQAHEAAGLPAKTEDTEDTERVKAYLQLRDYGSRGSGSVSCLCYHPSGERFLVSIGSLLLEFDSASLNLIRRKLFSGSRIHSVCYGEGCVVAGVSSHVVVMEMDLTERYTMQGTQTTLISSVVASPDGNHYYVVSPDGEIKMLDQSLRLCRIRRTRNRKKFSWARDRRTGCRQMVFLPTPDYPHGSRYRFGEDRMEPLGWCYEFEDMQSDEDSRQIYKFDTSVIAIDTQPPHNRIEFVNYGGLWIFGCSFAEVQGGIAEHRNRQLLKQNGGIVND